MIDPRFINVLSKLCNCLPFNEVTWAVTGSLGLALQGMNISAHDVDIQTDEPGAYRIEHYFPQNVVRKVVFSSTETIRSHFGELSIDGVKVEIMGDIQKRLPDGSWEDPVDICSKTYLINYNDLPILVFHLDYEYEAYNKLGRTERAKQIKNYIEKTKYDDNDNKGNLK